MTEPFISIIIPVYNEEKYLSQCLKSIQNQSYQNFEALMIDDGSSDSSLQICKKVELEDQRFRTYSQENAGIGMARNRGLDCAKGEYICFIDADDYVNPEFLQINYENIKETQSEMSICGYCRFTEESDIVPVQENLPRVLRKTDMIAAISTTGAGNRSEPIVMACNKMIAAKVFETIRFKNRWHEDEFIILEYIQKANRIVYTDKTLYYYRQHPSSVMGSANKKNLSHIDSLEAIQNRLQVLRGKEYEKVYPQVVKSYFENATILYLTMVDPDNRWKLIRRIYPQFVAALIRYGGTLGKRQIVKYVLFLISPQRYQKRFWK